MPWKCYTVSQSFNPRTPCGVRPHRSRPLGTAGPFQSTHSLRSATIRMTLGRPGLCCFNPRTPCGVRLRITTNPRTLPLFQSTHSLRSATALDDAIKTVTNVSIHALLAECDVHHRVALRKMRHVSIHALLAECDLKGLHGWATRLKFQSTHSLRSATRCCSAVTLYRGSFNPRTPCGVRPCRAWNIPNHHRFNPRTPCGVRLKNWSGKAAIATFQSTHSLRSATQAACCLYAGVKVSIHALLAECDTC